MTCDQSAEDMGRVPERVPAVDVSQGRPSNPRTSGAHGRQVKRGRGYPADLRGFSLSFVVAPEPLPESVLRTAMLRAFREWRRASEGADRPANNI